MDPSSTAGSPSKSKRRRIRDAMTRKRLYESAAKHNDLSRIQSQLAVLTCSIDSLRFMLAGFFQGTSFASHEETDPRSSEWPWYGNCCDVNNEQRVKVAEERRSDALQANQTVGAQETQSVAEPGQSIGHSNAPHDVAARETLCAGTWEPLDPWLFRDRQELAAMSQTCKSWRKLVDDNTPFFCWREADDCEREEEGHEDEEVAADDEEVPAGDIDRVNSIVDTVVQQAADSRGSRRTFRTGCQ